MAKLLPRQSVPDISVQTLGGGIWRLNQQPPKTFTLITFYRGLHCPICGSYLKQVEAALPKFSELGVEIIAISTDDQERARAAQEKWNLKALKIGYGLSLRAADNWGLYLSRGRSHEPDIFSEPGNFFIRPDGSLYAGIIQTMPFTRPPVEETLQSLAYVIEKDYPARGEFSFSDIDV